VHAKFVQELLGHATISITLDTYSHVLPSIGDAVARAMDEAWANSVAVREGPGNPRASLLTL
jgi:integrase